MSIKGWPYRSLGELREDLEKEGVRLPLSEDFSILNEKVQLPGLSVPNRIVLQPMEGCDGEHGSGAPGELTERRYLRFAQSGAGMIWFEATSVVREGRANPRQLLLTEENLPSYQRLLSEIREASLKEYGYAPAIILQATHSGRYSKPEGTPAPMIAYHSPVLEKEHALPESCIVTDEYLHALPEKYAETARLAELAGFDGMGVKACHRYLMCELLSAFERKGEYGGTFENRTRLYREAILSAKAATKDFLITSRLNIYDGHPYPFGFGMKNDGSTEEDLTEPVRLVRMMKDEWGIPLVDITLGNPYANPHVNRPYENGAYVPPESPFEGVARAVRLTGAVKKAVPEMMVVSSALSYLRQYAGNLAAGEVAAGICNFTGFGRMSFAYPEFPKDLLSGKGMDSRKCCLTCSKCTELMRSGSTPGCVLRDSEIYLPLYREKVLQNEKDIRHMVSNS